MGAPAFLRANRWCGMVAVTSCLGGFLVLGVSTQTRACPALHCTAVPCPTRHALTLRCVKPAYGSSHVLCLSHQDILAFRHPKSIALTCILEAFFTALGSWQSCLRKHLRFARAGCQCCCARVGDFYEPPGSSSQHGRSTNTDWVFEHPTPGPE